VWERFSSLPKEKRFEKALRNLRKLKKAAAVLKGGSLS
jgi:hypothetical protein